MAFKKLYGIIKANLQRNADVVSNGVLDDVNKKVDESMPHHEEKEKKALAWVFRLYLGILLLSVAALSIAVYENYKKSRYDADTISEQSLKKDVDTTLEKSSDNSKLSKVSSALKENKVLNSQNHTNYK